MTPRRSFFAAASWLLAAALAPASEIVTRTVSVDILADGTTRTRTHLEVHLASARDVDVWSPYSIPLNEDCKIDELSGSITHPDGSTKRLKRSDLDTVGKVSESTLASSSSYRLIRFPDAPVGSRLTLDYTLLGRPFYPADSVRLQSQLAPTANLVVSVRGGGALFRHHLSGSSGALTVKPIEGGVIVTGVNVPALEDPPDGPALWCAGLRLSFGWGREASWEDVARWWTGLISTLPAPAAGVDAVERELRLPGRPFAEVVADVLAFVHAHVRYVAVELGIGGWKPADPETTLVRGWGDCKALAVLTATLLRRAGIEAEAAAVTIGEGTMVDPEFPTLRVFDHMVVAVPARAVERRGIVDVSGAWVFLDPTVTTQGLDRVSAHLRDRRMLLLRDASPALVTTAAAPEEEARRLRVDLVVAEDGSARGTASLDLAGEGAAAWLALSKTGRPADLEIESRRLLASLLPTAEVLKISWGAREGLGAAVVVAAEVSFRALLASGQTSSWFQAGGPVVMPAASTLASRSVPLVLTPQLAETAWSVRLPSGWRLAPIEATGVSNELGAFHETLRVEGQVSEIVRRAELRRRVIDTPAFGLLREVATAEHRAQRRRLIVERPAATPGAAP